MYQAIRDLLQGNDFVVGASFQIPGQEPRYAELPKFLYDSPVGTHLASSRPAGLWAHQAQALDALGRGKNVVLSTGTASGKSLVFQSIALHKVLLDPSSRVIVFYPLRALVADQLRSWKAFATSLGVGEETIGHIDTTLNYVERESILSKARIAIMTPDLCHAWLMSRLSIPAIKEFVRGLSTIVVDEAHSMESVFGSNCAFLIRRLTSARNYIVETEANHQPLQYVGATATIEGADGHMHQLTGAKFTVVDHQFDGAPHSDRIVAHVVCPPGGELSVAKEIQIRLLTDKTQGTFITFVDSRKGVEKLVVATELDIKELTSISTVSPYRAGFSSDERRAIESRLRSGSLKGVVSTSALELGIDISHLTVGINVGVPISRKSHRQRLGRIGRSGPGAFIVVAPADAFSRYGTSLEEYHGMSVEPSYLYLDNRFMQFAHARCLSEKRDSLAAPGALPNPGSWPPNFREIYPMARPGGNRPLEFDAIAELGGDSPQYGYPLRNVGEFSFNIKLHSDADALGDVTQSQALRECYPGGTYIHNTKAYEVVAWRLGPAPFIQIKPTSPYRLTNPQIVTWINAEISSSSLMEENLRMGRDGFGSFLAECQMLITERVEGYRDRGGKFHSYRELQQHNLNMRGKTRNFRTSGIILCMDDDCFKDSRIRRVICDRLRDAFLHEYSIDPRDIGSASTHIAIRTPDGSVRHNGCIVIYDETYGSLRFTEKLYDNFDHMIDRLSYRLIGEDGANLSDCVAKMRDISNTIYDVPAGVNEPSSTDSDYERVFAEGSVVCHREHGQIARDVEIIRPTIIDGELRYQVKHPERPGHPPVRSWVRASRLEPSGNSDSWDYAWWNRVTEEYEDTSGDPEDSE